MACENNRDSPWRSDKRAGHTRKVKIVMENWMDIRWIIKILPPITTVMVRYSFKEATINIGG